ncbi:MAG: hypothetical protein EU541_04925 [Promethearchaeota archaeon]|nr:MAG: hypothetical protein EU541_04925 [Candidatus Lokiarchaeota archaeon]
MDITKKGFYFIGVIIALYVWIIILFLAKPIEPKDVFIQLSVLIGFTSLFLAAIITPFMKQVYQMFGTSFIKIHHLFSILGLTLITIHPISIAIIYTAPEVFIPKFDSWEIFWNLAGRPALYLLYVAVVAVIIRKYLPQKSWRILHGLIYVALVFGYFHGVLIGDDFENMWVMITFTAMMVLLFEVLIYKRYQKYKMKQKK